MIQESVSLKYELAVQGRSGLTMVPLGGDGARVVRGNAPMLGVDADPRPSAERGLRPSLLRQYLLLGLGFRVWGLGSLQGYLAHKTTKSNGWSSTTSSCACIAVQGYLAHKKQPLPRTIQ